MLSSKEALQNIRDYHNETVYDIDNIYTENMFEKELDIIEKDLEILDILKKWIEVRATNYDLVPYEISVKNAYVSSRSCLVLTKEDYIKIKVWLENDK